MTEAEWLACTDPQKMLEFLRGQASDRKLRLFGCGCCRLVWEKVPNEDRAAVELAEMFADNHAVELELTSLQQRMQQDYSAVPEPSRFGDGWASAYHVLSFPAWGAADAAFRTAAISVWVDVPGFQTLRDQEEGYALLCNMR